MPQTTDSTFCVLPWVHLATHPLGIVSLCCRVDYSTHQGIAGDSSQDTSDQSAPLYTLNNQKLDQIINSQNFRNVRLEMLAGKKPKACLLGALHRRSARHDKQKAAGKCRFQSFGNTRQANHGRVRLHLARNSIRGIALGQFMQFKMSVMQSPFEQQMDSGL